MAAEPVVTSDLDFYVFSAWQLREAGHQARRRLQTDKVNRRLDGLIADLDAAIPHLKDYRNMMTHGIDDVFEDLAWFGPFAVKLLPGDRLTS